MRQQRLLLRLLHLRDQRAAVAVGGGEEAPGHVVAEERDGGGVTPVLHSQSAAGIRAVLGVGERRLRAESDIRQVDAVLSSGVLSGTTTESAKFQPSHILTIKSVMVPP